MDVRATLDRHKGARETQIDTNATLKRHKGDIGETTWPSKVFGSPCR